MQTADFNPDDFTQQGTAEADKGLLVRFFYNTVPDKQATEKEGRPVFKEVEYIEIRIPGKRDAQACRPATFADKKRFPEHYKAFKDRVDMPEMGWPLSEWPQITRSQAEELSFQNIKTVEQLAACPDSSIGNIMGGYGLKEKAQKALEEAKNPAAVAEKTRELEVQNKKLLEQNAELASQVGALNKKVEALIDKMLGVDETPAETPAEIPPSALDEEVEEKPEEAQNETEDEAEAQAAEEATEEEAAEAKPKRRSRSKK